MDLNAKKTNHSSRNKLHTFNYFHHFKMNKKIYILLIILFTPLISYSIVRIYFATKTLYSSINETYRYKKIECEKSIDSYSEVICKRKKFINKLLLLQKIEPSIKKNMLLFIPKTNRVFWDWPPLRERCHVTSTIAPAISEIPSLNGLPTKLCYKKEKSIEQNGYSNDYGFGSYKKPYDDETQSSYKENVLCKKAIALGKNIISIIDNDLEIKTVNCQNYNVGRKK